MFQESSLVFHGSLKSVSRKYYGTFKDAASGSFKGASEKFQGCFKFVSLVIQENFKGLVSRPLGGVSQGFQ